METMNQTVNTKVVSKPRESSADRLRRLVECFVTGKGRVHQHNSFYSNATRLYHVSGTHFEPGTTDGVKTTIAIRIAQPDGSTLVLGNSSILELVGAHTAWGSFQRNRRVTPIQRLLETMIPMLPFTVFEQAKLDISKVRVVDKAAPETITRKVFVKRDYQNDRDIFREETIHFTGASLFEIDGTYFLFDIDRREIKNKVFNPFLVKLPGAVKTIAKAYASLKPTEVIKAEKRGLKVLRQGEWFFIPCAAPKLRNEKTRQKKLAQHREMVKGLRYGSAEWHRAELERMELERGLPRQLELRAGRNRPNYVSRGLEVKRGQFLVSGTVTHSGREHEPLHLGTKWYRAVPNTATESWQITGDID